jgi:hypothetical protein
MVTRLPANRHRQGYRRLVSEWSQATAFVFLFDLDGAIADRHIARRA